MYTKEHSDSKTGRFVTLPNQNVGYILSILEQNTNSSFEPPLLTITNCR